MHGDVVREVGQLVMRGRDGDFVAEDRDGQGGDLGAGLFGAVGLGLEGVRSGS